MNRTIMMGRIANDPELKTTPNGVSVCTFRIAVERNFQKKGEERKADFFNVTAWRGTAEFVHNYFGKGRMILVEGEFQTTPYTDKNGNNATWYELVAENVYFTGEKANDNQSGGGQQHTAAPKNQTVSQTAPPVAQNNQFSNATDADDDYPF